MRASHVFILTAIAGFAWLALAPAAVVETALPIARAIAEFTGAGK